ncbi:Multidrug resistance protein MdtE precursor [Pseudobythopirellula maris]|uniref:Multidrug resistance protein MdtE n=1 Tax=Pseudobythopirellula maris TaxID=2527991 RepID=A0A5C5ZSA6_9BACT|nr:efflux RND transporter periplasmic adaptor subunit [Pseudobythopirellula maris]TWT90424.1 Multidrug resistance protein MdtE precursor [Pseudobythopirellula maris]
MRKSLARFGRFGFLVLLTVAAFAAMWWVSSKSDGTTVSGSEVAAPSPTVASKTPVVAIDAEPRLCDVTVKFSGRIEPWETYTLGFEIGGRVLELGVNEAGAPLDDGDRVSAGQVLARLDDRVLRARQSEAVAQYEQAASDMQRARRLRELNSGALTDSEYQEYLTTLALAKAGQEMAVKNLEDSAIVSPVDGVISRRMVEAGESVGANDAVFEVIENRDLLLVVGVPESRVLELQSRLRAVAEARRGPLRDPEDGVFRARVQLEGRDVYGARYDRIDAEVYRIAQTAHETTGLFDIEIRIPNEENRLRAGMIATAEIVTDRLLAYRLPETAVLFRSGKSYLFTVDRQTEPMQVMFWDSQPTDVWRARRVDLARLVDLGQEVLVPAGEVELSNLVVRGHQRLADGQLVRLIDSEEEPTESNFTAGRL